MRCCVGLRRRMVHRILHRFGSGEMILRNLLIIPAGDPRADNMRRELFF
jgi:hypothetical protein